MTTEIIVDYIGRFPHLPSHTMGGLIRYWQDHCPVGDFLTAVLSNNLMSAVFHADEQNRPALHDICMFIYTEMPSDSHGSPERVEAWLDRTTE